MQNVAKINKNRVEIFLMKILYGSLKELFYFNEFAKFIYLIILERYYFITNHVTKYVVSYIQIKFILWNKLKD